MEYIGNRISIKRSDNEVSIVILSFREKIKNIMLSIYLVLWSLSGIIVFSQLLVIPDKNTKLALFVWLCFWAYFEFKISKAYMWRKFGVEKIKLREN